METPKPKMPDAVKNVCIVGGGTAGWLSALLLEHNHGVRRNGPDGVNITLVESPDRPTVGVGEATVPSMPMLLHGCGISEGEFFKECNATFKLGVMFNGWNVDNDQNPINYLNPFGPIARINNIRAAEYFLKFGGYGLEYIQTVTASLDLISKHKAPRPLKIGDYANSARYAYHMDAGLFAQFLKKKCLDRGIRYIQDNVVGVGRNDTGDIKELKLEASGEESVDFVIDCTGFGGEIISKILREPFDDYSKYLANDRAIALQVPHQDDAKIQPTTKSTALSNGWSWHVPLRNRVGTGYVYSSSHVTDEQAAEEFLAHLGRQNEADQLRVIPIRVGRSRNAWVHNCVAIGLSGGFIEPLESTAIHMIEKSVRWLSLNWPQNSDSAPLRDQYNALTDRMYNEVRDFICLHYALGNRTDSQYWIDAREQLQVPDSLAQNLEIWKRRLPMPEDIGYHSLFSDETYATVLLGKQSYQSGFGAGSFAIPKTLNEGQWKQYLQHMRLEVDQIVGQNASHNMIIRELRNEFLPMTNLTPFGVPR